MKFQVLKYPYVPVIIAFCILAIVLIALVVGKYMFSISSFLGLLK